MRVLIGCECSGIVRDAFRAMGHEAWSCDLKPCEGNAAWHLQMDVRQAICGHGPWDFIGLHPDCTKLTVSGNHKYAKGKPGWDERKAAVTWTCSLYEEARAVAPRGYLENPRGVLTTLGTLPRPQEIQPYAFGHDASKLTCLWLWGVPPLVATQWVEPRWVCGCGYTFEGDEYDTLGKYGCPNCCGDYQPRPRWANQTDSGQNRLGPSETRKTDRSRTYSGIADAMAEQWGISND